MFTSSWLTANTEKLGSKNTLLTTDNFFSTVSSLVSGVQCNMMPARVGFAQGRFYCIGPESLVMVDQLLALHTRDLDSHAQLTCSTVRIYWSALRARALIPPSYPSSISPAAEPFDPSAWWPTVYLLYDAIITTTTIAASINRVFSGSFSYLTVVIMFIEDKL